MNSLGYSAVGSGSVSDGTAGTGVTAVTHGDGYNMVTVLTMDGAVLPAIEAGAHAYGLKVFTFPSGTTRVKCTRMNIAITQSDGNINNDTPEVGVGSVIATGAVLVLNGTTEFDDYVVEQTATNCTGTATEKAEDTVGAGLKLNEAGTKTVHLNVADTWAGTDSAATLSGTIHLEWTFLGA